jgi:preprotein translocase subunit YajC
MLNRLSLLLMQVQDAAPKSENIFWVILPPLAIILVLYLVMDSPQRRERKKRDAMMKGLKKDDRVVTIGGILGSVANISQDGKEVTLKVDDGTRIRFRRSAIAEVLTGDDVIDTTKST